MTTHVRRALAGAVVLLVSACSTPAPRSTPTAAAPSADRPSRHDTPPHATPRRARAPALDRAIAQRLEALPDNASHRRIHRAVRAFYAARDDAPGWFEADGTPQPALQSLLDSLAKADRQGLNGADYGYTSLARRVDAIANAPGPSPTAIAAADVRLSHAFVAYAVDLHHGRVVKPELRRRWARNQPSATDYAGALSTAADDGDVDAALAALTPPHDGYTLLVKALADYRSIAQNGGWPQLPDGDTLEVGMHDARVPALRARLRLTDDLPAPPDAATADSDDRYDARLARAVRHFQDRHGLKVDGRVGPNTRAALDVPAVQRVSQIKINLERWRWLPGELGERYLMVNIPAYRLRAFDHGKPVLAMDVIVGKSYNDRATPVFTDTMRYVVFRPYWNVPHDIAVDEILPKARADSDYLAARHYQIVRAFGPNAKVLAPSPAHLDAVDSGGLNVRQAAGPHNALGLVKFIFPNDYAVYLHDTPSEQLFSRAERDFSHGCVRVEHPAALAHYVLSDRPAWDAARIDAALHEGSRQRVDLEAPLPVYLIYWTAFVNDEGVQFRSDLYERDARLETAMQRERNTMPPGAS